MNILYCGLDNTPYPDRSLEVRVADYMAEQGNTVHLVVERLPKYEGDRPKGLDVTIGPVVEIALNQQQPSNEFIDQLVQKQFDIVFSSSVSGVKLAHLVAKRKGVPWVVQILDIPAYRFNFPQYRAQWKEWLDYAIRANRIVVNTKTARGWLDNAFKNWYGTSRQYPPTTLVYYGVDHVTAGRALKKPVDKPYISAVGRLVWDKGFELLFYALTMQSDPLEVKLVGNGPEVARLLETAAMCGNKVDFRGATSDPQKFEVVKNSLFGVYTDINTFKSGLFPLECLVTGRPCIAWDTPVNRERYMEYIQYVPYMDLRQLSNTIQAFTRGYFAFTGKKLDLDQVGETGRQWVLENRTYKQHSAQLMEAFREALDAQ